MFCVHFRSCGCEIDVKMDVKIDVNGINAAFSQTHRKKSYF